MGKYDHLIQAWKDTKTGLYHLSLIGTNWPSRYIKVTMEEYRGNENKNKTKNKK